MSVQELLRLLLHGHPNATVAFATAESGRGRVGPTATS